jgi:hypothetical protein
MHPVKGDGTPGQSCASDWLRAAGRFASVYRLRRSWLAIALLTACVPLTAYLATRAPSISWSNGGADGGDLAAAVATFGVPHPPGYPTYTLLGMLWSTLPIGSDLGSRLVLFSVAGGALTSVLLGTSASYMARRCGVSRGCASIAGAIAGIAWGLSPIAWSQSVIVEVYAPGMVWVGLATLLLLHAQAKTRSRLYFASGLTVGLGYGALPQIVLLVPSSVALLAGWWGEPGRTAKVVAAMIGCLIGLMVFAYVPIRAWATPSLSWGEPTTPSGLAALMTASVYRAVPESIGAAERLVRVGESFVIVGFELGILAPLVLVGVGVLARKQRGPAALLLALTILTVGFRASYPAEGNIVYLLPATYAASMLAGVGLGAILGTVHARSQVGAWGVALVVLAATVLRLPTTFVAVDASQDQRERQFWHLVLNTVTDGALVVSEHDETTFSLWYRQALGGRPDLVVVDARLLTHAWYRSHLAQQHPDLDAQAIRPGGLTALGRPIFRVRYDPLDASGAVPELVFR